MRGLLAAALVCVAQIAGAQEETALADGALLRGLDKVSGAVHDIALRSGKSIEIGNLHVALGECRYPVANPVGDAFVYLNIQNVDTNDTVFTAVWASRWSAAEKTSTSRRKTTTKSTPSSTAAS